LSTFYKSNQIRLNYQNLKQSIYKKEYFFIKMTSEEKKEWLKCALDPIYFIETYLTVFDMTQNKTVPFKLFPFQKILIASYNDNLLNITNKYRQAGISTITCAFIAHHVMFNSKRMVAVVADKVTTAKNELMKDVCMFIDQTPSWLRPKYSDSTKSKTHIELSNGSEVKALAANSLRGLTPTLIFWDEVAHCQHAEEFWTSAAATTSTGGAVIMVSTPNSFDPIFYKTFDGAINKNNEFIAHNLFWYEDPRYNIDLEWVKDEIRIKTKDPEIYNNLIKDDFKPTSTWYREMCAKYNGDIRKINQELNCDFLGSGGTFVDPEDIRRQEERFVIDPIQKDHDDKLWIWELPLDGEQYIQVGDVSSGTGEDSSAITIFKIERDKNRLTQVVEYNGKIDPDKLGSILYQYGTKYNNAYTVVDITNGLGTQTISTMIGLGYKNLHYDTIKNNGVRTALLDYIVNDGDKQMIPGFWIGVNRPIMLSEMKRAIRDEEIIIKSTRVISELRTFINVNGTRIADHTRSSHDDIIFTLAIGIYVYMYEMEVMLESIEKTKKMLESWTFGSTNNDSTFTEERKVNKSDNRHNPYGQNAWLFK
jgi:hypothetical protein